MWKQFYNYVLVHTIDGGIDMMRVLKSDCRPVALFRTSTMRNARKALWKQQATIKGSAVCIEIFHPTNCFHCRRMVLPGDLRLEPNNDPEPRHSDHDSVEFIPSVGPVVAQPHCD